MEKLLELLATHGGKIVSTNDLNPDEINQARASNRMYVDEDSLGYVWLPAFHGRFPVTVSEVEMFEWCYPLEVEIPKECSFENVLLSAVVYQSDGRIFNYLSKVKPPMNKHIFIHTKDDEVISCTARKTDVLEFHFREFKGYAEEHEVVGWSFH